MDTIKVVLGQLGSGPIIAIQAKNEENHDYARIKVYLHDELIAHLYIKRVTPSGVEFREDECVRPTLRSTIIGVDTTGTAQADLNRLPSIKITRKVSNETKTIAEIFLTIIREYGAESEPRYRVCFTNIEIYWGVRNEKVEGR